MRRVHLERAVEVVAAAVAAAVAGAAAMVEVAEAAVVAAVVVAVEVVEAVVEVEAADATKLIFVNESRPGAGPGGTARTILEKPPESSLFSKPVRKNVTRTLQKAPQLLE
jgi:hypothetical protein